MNAFVDVVLQHDKLRIAGCAIEEDVSCGLSNFGCVNGDDFSSCSMGYCCGVVARILSNHKGVSATVLNKLCSNLVANGLEVRLGIIRSIMLVVSRDRASLSCDISLSIRHVNKPDVRIGEKEGGYVCYCQTGLRNRVCL